MVVQNLNALRTWWRDHHMHLIFPVLFYSISILFGLGMALVYIGVVRRNSHVLGWAPLGVACALPLFGLSLANLTDNVLQRLHKWSTRLLRVLLLDSSGGLLAWHILGGVAGVAGLGGVIFYTVLIIRAKEAVFPWNLEKTFYVPLLWTIITCKNGVFLCWETRKTARQDLLKEVIQHEIEDNMASPRNSPSNMTDASSEPVELGIPRNLTLQILIDENRPEQSELR